MNSSNTLLVSRNAAQAPPLLSSPHQMKTLGAELLLACTRRGWSGNVLRSLLIHMALSFLGPRFWAVGPSWRHTVQYEEGFRRVVAAGRSGFLLQQPGAPGTWCLCTAVMGLTTEHQGLLLLRSAMQVVIPELCEAYSLAARLSGTML